MGVKLLIYLFILVSVSSCIHNKYERAISGFSNNGDTLAVSCVEFIAKNADEDDVTYTFIKNHVKSSIDTWKHNRCVDMIPFGDFQEYILPYKYDNFDIENKYDFFNNDRIYFNSFDTLNDIFDIIDSLRLKYYYISYSDKFDRTENLEDFLQQAKANCGTMSMFNEILFSSVGLPVTTDFINQWANTSGDHAWNVVLLNNEFYPFDAFYEPNAWVYKKMYNNITIDTLYGKKRISKVFRKTFSANVTDLIYNEHYKNIPKFYRNTKMIDVSGKYYDTTNILIKVPDSIQLNNKYVWLATFNNRSFTPAFWAKVENGGAQFKNMGRDILYFLATYNDETVSMFGNPIYCDVDGNIHQVEVSGTEKEDIVLNRKYPYLNVSPDIYNSALRSAVLFGVNKDNSIDKININTSLITSLCDTIVLNYNRRKQYNKYVLSISYDTLSSNDCRIINNDFRTIADINLFVKSTNNEIIDIKPKYYNGQHSNIFDDNTLTYYTPNSKDTVNIVMSFDDYIELYAINITPKNDKNYIYKGVYYELMQWKDNKWRSIETKKSQSNTIEFTNVPKGALLRLKCKDEGKEERIFRYINSQQVWY